VADRHLAPLFAPLKAPEFIHNPPQAPQPAIYSVKALVDNRPESAADPSCAEGPLLLPRRTYEVDGGVFWKSGPVSRPQRRAAGDVHTFYANETDPFCREHV